MSGNASPRPAVASGMTLRPLGWLFLVVTLSACDLRGLDLYQPVDAREYAQSCARSRTDVYCAALLPTLAATKGPVTLIMPNMGDDERNAALKAVLADKGLTVEAFRKDEAAQAALARANIFPVDRLTTGEHRTLDGQPHQVRCAQDGQGTPPQVTCQIDSLVGWNHLQHLPPGSGSVYATLGPSADALPFFPF